MVNPCSCPGPGKDVAILARQDRLFSAQLESLGFRAFVALRPRAVVPVPRRAPSATVPVITETKRIAVGRRWHARVRSLACLGPPSAVLGDGRLEPCSTAQR